VFSILLLQADRQRDDDRFDAMKFRFGMPGMSLYPGAGRHWWEHITPTQVREIAREFDRLGYDYVSVSEHLIMDRHSAW
jgi:alkanesulfonate monooxygenase SsuD/methylene tetrahydromethanopterin reductase-like flavin-dependent oxidoreductase (luciferase family)